MIKWRSARKYSELRLRLDAVEAIVAFKEAFIYSELSEILGIPPSVLSRYYQGDMVPSVETARSILSELKSEKIVKKFIYKLLDKRKGDLLSIVSDSKVLPFLAQVLEERIIGKLAGTSINRLVAPPDHSVALASLVASRLGLPLSLIESAITPAYERFLRPRPLMREESVVAVYIIFSDECFEPLQEFLTTRKLSLKMITALVGSHVKQEILKGGVIFDRLIP